MQPDLAEAHNNLGNVLAGRRAYQEASHHFEKAIRADPNYVDAHHSLGVVRALMGAHAEAITALRAAIVIAPDRPQVRIDLADVLATIGSAVGCPISESGEDRMAVTARLGSFKTSMLQDVEAGRPIELEALLGAPREIARRKTIPTPKLDLLYAQARLLGESLSLL